MPLAMSDDILIEETAPREEENPPVNRNYRQTYHSLDQLQHCCPFYRLIVI